MKQYVIIDEQLVDKDDATISVFDLAVQRGYGIFDYFKTVNNQPLWLEDHLDRFYNSASEMHLSVPVSRQQLTTLIGELISKNNIPASGIRITLTGGVSANDFNLEKPTMMITQSPLIYDRKSFDKGVRLMSFDYQRQLSHVKTIDYLQAIQLQPTLERLGADDILYHSAQEVRESPRANVFIVDKNDHLLTPSRQILGGITRKKILGFPGFDAAESDISLQELLDAKEVFLTSTTKTVLPVLQVDGKDIGTGKPGDATRAIWIRLLNEQGIQ